jgi:hypothetical protein
MPMVTSQPKLLDQVRVVIRSKRYLRRTEATYIDWITRYLCFHETRHPCEWVRQMLPRFLPT